MSQTRYSNLTFFNKYTSHMYQNNYKQKMYSIYTMYNC